MDNLRAARREARAGVKRATRLLREAQQAGSPLQPFVARYVAQKAAYELVAASHAAAIARLERET